MWDNISIKLGEYKVLITYGPTFDKAMHYEGFPVNIWPLKLLPAVPRQIGSFEFEK